MHLNAVWHAKIALILPDQKKPRNGNRVGTKAKGLVKKASQKMIPDAEGPKGEKRPADVIGNAILVAMIATGEVLETPSLTPWRCI